MRLKCVQLIKLSLSPSIPNNQGNTMHENGEDTYLCRCAHQKIKTGKHYDSHMRGYMHLQIISAIL